MAHTETAHMFYGNERMSINVLGVLIIQNHGNGRGITIKNVAMVSDIIDSDTKAAAMFLVHSRQWVENIDSVKHISMWSDCGPHFRAFDHIGYCFKSWYVPFHCDMRIAFFGEKHGKGLVDALFAQVRAWIRLSILKPGVVLKHIDGLVTALREGARHSMS